MILDYMKMAVSNLGHRKIRSWLTMIGIFIGITAVIAIISLGQGLKVAINEQFAELGTDKIFVQPGTSAFGGATAVRLTDSDRDVIERVPGVVEVTGASYKSARIERKDDQVFGLVWGLNVDNDLWKQMNEKNVIEGRFLEKGDSFKAYVGYDYTQDDAVFDRRLHIGDKLTINGQTFEIVGFQENFGNSNDNQAVQITEDAYERVFGERMKDDYDMLIARIDQSMPADQIADDMKRDLGRHRDRDEGDEDFTLQTAEQFIDAFNSVLLIVQVVILGIAAVSLVIGGVGIMNTMYTAVVERTNEIGVMKAIGARNSDIMLIFLIESALLGFVGGAIGVGLGLGIAKAVEIVAGIALDSPFLKAYFSWWLVIGAILFAMIVGMASGLLPARQASKHKPVDSLRYE
jgi:putative ABC transport system permease protein